MSHAREAKGAPKHPRKPKRPISNLLPPPPTPQKRNLAAPVELNLLDIVTQAYDSSPP
ncbi:hypothetical protein D9M71_624620 [compost metagenome]